MYLRSKTSKESNLQLVQVLSNHLLIESTKIVIITLSDVVNTFYR